MKLLESFLTNMFAKNDIYFLIEIECSKNSKYSVEAPNVSYVPSDKQKFSKCNIYSKTSCTKDFTITILSCKKLLYDESNM